MRKEPGKRAGMLTDEGGYIMVMSVFVMVIMVIIGIVLIVVGMGELELSSRTHVMEKVYDIAEAGVSRGVLEARYHVFSGYLFNTPQWFTTEEIGGGTYTVEVWPDDRGIMGESEDPNYKVIKSTGTYQKGSKYRATRTMEARVRIDAWSDDYDAAFDYVIFNNDTTPPTDPRGGRDPWPKSTFLLGKFVWDGISAYDSGQELHAPKGAIYTKGNMDFSTVGGGKLEIKGNIVATGDINLSNVFDLYGGIDIKGNVVAGARSDWEDSATSAVPFMNGGDNAAGDVYLDVTLDPSATKEGIRVDGLVAAARDVKIDSVVATGLKSAIKVGGVRAGRDVTISGTVNLNLAWPVEVGKDYGVYCSRDFSAKSTFLGGLDIGDVWSGRNVSGIARFSSDKIGHIKANNAVTLTADYMGSLRTGSIEAGAGGVAFNRSGLVISILNIETGSKSGYSIKSLGDVTMSLSGFSLGYFEYVALGRIVSNGNINLDARIGGNLCYLDLRRSVGAKGSVRLRANQSVKVGADSGRSVTSENSWVSLESVGFIPGNIDLSGSIMAGTTASVTNTSALTWTRIGSVEALGNVSLNTESMLQVNGTVRSRDGDATVNARGCLSRQNRVTNGIWARNVDARLEQGWFYTASRPSMYIGRLSGTDDSIRATGSVTLRPNPYWWFSHHGIYLGRGVSNSNPPTPGYVTYQGGYSASPSSNVHYGGSCGPRGGTVAQPTVGSTAVETLTAPAAPTRGTGGEETAYDIDIPGAADLTGTAVFPEPNWSYFYKMAYSDDLANPGAPHVLEDTGLAADGDYDGSAGNGQILFKWDNTTPYSSNETVYNGDANVVLKIQALDWSNKAADFEGTLVSKGNVLVDDATTTWWVKTGNKLNVISGGGILWHNLGLALVKETDCYYHFYAAREIDLGDATFSLGYVAKFNGSFTAGWYVLLFKNTGFNWKIWEDITWKWSRFTLDPDAWMPQYRVFSYREVENPARSDW